MKVRISEQFIIDLIKHDDRKIARRAIDHIFDMRGQFKPGNNDHRYHGINDAWIRYVSKGKTAYRIIYIKDGEKVILYRCGGHSIEDNLAPPGELAGYAVRSFRPDTTKDKGQMEIGVLLDGINGRKIRNELLSMLHVGHREIWLISPFITWSLLSHRNPLGRFLFRANEEGTAISILTRPPVSPTKELQQLVREEIGVFFLNNLHSKLYIFDVDQEKINEPKRGQVNQTAIIGSANLTEAALDLRQEANINEEICYRLPSMLFEQARQYAQRLLDKSADYVSYERIKSRQ